MTRLDRSRAAIIRSQYAEGHSTEHLAGIWNVHKTTITKIVANEIYNNRFYRSPIRPKATDLYPEIRELRKQGKTFTEIGQLLAAKHGRIRAYGRSTIRAAYLKGTK